MEGGKWRETIVNKASWGDGGNSKNYLSFCARDQHEFNDVTVV